jgi:prophage maintenance system killer protein
MDGNKRTANFLLRLMLLEYNLDILSFDDERYDMTIDASTGTIRFDEIKLWIEQRLIEVDQ